MKYPQVKVGDLVDQVRGVTYSSGDSINAPKDGYVELLRANNIGNGQLNFEGLAYVPSKIVSAKQYLKLNDILIATSSGSISVVGKAASFNVNRTSTFGAFCKVLRPTAKVDARYIANYFQTSDYRRTISSLAEGANINNLRNEHIDNLDILLPPLHEQQRIAAILDKAAAIKAKREHTFLLTQATIDSLFTELIDNESKIEYCSLDDCLTRIIDYRGKTPVKTPSGVPLITAKVVKNGELLEPTEFIAKDNYVEWMSRGIPECGDVLFTTEAPLGEVAILDRDDVALAQRLVLLRPNPEILNSTFLRYALTCDSVKRDIQTRSTGSTVKGIRQKELRLVKLPVVSMEQQDVFAKRVSQLIFLSKKIRQALEKNNLLFSSLQHQAFTTGFAA